MTAIEAWVIVCVLFVFGALAEYAGVLLKIKIAATKSSSYYPGRRGLESPVANSIVLANGNTILQDEYSVKFSDVSRRYTYEEVNIKKFGSVSSIHCNYNQLYLLHFLLQEKQQSIELRRHMERRDRDEQNHAKLDMIFLMIFPIIFLSFNLVYWITLVYFLEGT